MEDWEVDEAYDFFDPECTSVTYEDLLQHFDKLPSTDGKIATMNDWLDTWQYIKDLPED